MRLTKLFRNKEKIQWAEPSPNDKIPNLSHKEGVHRGNWLGRDFKVDLLEKI